MTVLVFYLTALLRIILERFCFSIPNTSHNPAIFLFSYFPISTISWCSRNELKNFAILSFCSKLLFGFVFFIFCYELNEKLSENSDRWIVVRPNTQINSRQLSLTPRRLSVREQGFPGEWSVNKGEHRNAKGDEIYYAALSGIQDELKKWNARTSSRGQWNHG